MNATTQTAETYYVTQVRRPGSETWAKLHVERTALAAAMALTDALTTHGMHHSDIHGLREDLVAGHILTADDGYAFRIELRETAPEPDAEQTLRATSDDALIDALLRLTHQISGESAGRREAKSRGWIPDAARHLNAENDLRAKRDLLRAEILRRMGGAR